MLKKFVACFITTLLLINCPIQTYATDIGVRINGANVIFTKDSGIPFIDSASRMQVPLRQTMEAYGCTVNWNQSSQTATVEKDGVIVKVCVGKKYIYKDDELIPNDTAAIIKDGRVYLPIRVVLNALGANVIWNPDINHVIITSTSLIDNFYSQNIEVPDFGKYAGEIPPSIDSMGNSTIYHYSIVTEEMVTGYKTLLSSLGFSYQKSELNMEIWAKDVSEKTVVVGLMLQETDDIGNVFTVGVGYQ